MIQNSKFKIQNFQGSKIEIKSRRRLTKRNLPILYTPGVAELSREIAKNKKKVFELTWKKNSVAIVSDGSAILGLGNLGPEAALPVMEGKSVLFKELANVDAVPIILATQDTEKIIETVKNIAPGFGGINLEDISAPRCFEIEKRLVNELDIPVFHDDQHGTAIAVLAGLVNALKVVKKNIRNVRIVISGAGAAGTAVTKLLSKYGARKIVVFDSKGSLCCNCLRKTNGPKKEIACVTGNEKFFTSVGEALEGADVFIGVSTGRLLTAGDIRRMNKGAIVFAMSNPVPEISYKEGKKGGAAVMATGRSDFPNQINNALVFPGLFRGALDARTNIISEKIKIGIALAIASLVKNPKSDKIVPDVLDRRVARVVAKVFK
ncbi:MAG: malic enzyme, malate dehydrogenase (oxaloacetate-decarboxylating) [Candidatus Moranbacteria bacterium GW2011_GWC1_45_18]|nr:MAG: Malate dehydrogenase (Oxaloacetate-decarboxylating) [Candidatus Moranbacteria bacterium GW2011_GWC2_40_12]KKT33989.1 MAG: Malate dehydrogenase (Oxaloacetate-decarboxylating) [Candidatus Moranbacteria bacterium GW2011_GWF2_44_10]KKT71655.1 MAG: Malate dehydrogenase (Oxaloacetate-decarboxylating) [Candidatus Moranbacteria bacterium GW2011_GWF1_44_4]KKT99345.1 MAG: malic enzyme, malate dehydrogenase (oxaloacetate-decarboxylating) [Candidatus Moranbacteria bacterium GW2011_GWC1_45_18]